MVVVEVDSDRREPAGTGRATGAAGAGAPPEPATTGVAAGGGAAEETGTAPAAGGPLRLETAAGMPGVGRGAGDRGGDGRVAALAGRGGGPRRAAWRCRVRAAADPPERLAVGLGLGPVALVVGGAVAAAAVERAE